jgi:hypothetical protein
VDKSVVSALVFDAMDGVIRRGAVRDSVRGDRGVMRAVATGSYYGTIGSFTLLGVLAA